MSPLPFTWTEADELLAIDPDSVAAAAAMYDRLADGTFYEEHERARQELLGRHG